MHKNPLPPAGAAMPIAEALRASAPLGRLAERLRLSNALFAAIAPVAAGRPGAAHQRRPGRRRGLVAALRQRRGRRQAAPAGAAPGAAPAANRRWRLRRSGSRCSPVERAVHPSDGSLSAPPSNASCRRRSAFKRCHPHDHEPTPLFRRPSFRRRRRCHAHAAPVCARPGRGGRAGRGARLHQARAAPALGRAAGQDRGARVLLVRLPALQRLRADARGRGRRRCRPTSSSSACRCRS